MITSETGQFPSDFRNSVRFLCKGTCSAVPNRLRWIMPGKFVRAYSVCEVPSGTLLFPPNCFFPNILLSDLLSLPCYTGPNDFILQKLFQFDKVDIPKCVVKSGSKFSLIFNSFSIGLVDLILIFTINYKKYKDVLFSKRN